MALLYGGGLGTIGVSSFFLLHLKYVTEIRYSFGWTLGVGTQHLDIGSNLFAITGNKEAFVPDCYRLNDGVIIWDINFVSQAQDWSLELLLVFFQCFFL